MLIQEGTVPVLISVPHDGTLTSLAGQELEEYDTIGRDTAAGILALDTFSEFKIATGEDLGLVITLIKRKNVHPEILRHFEKTVIDKLQNLSNKTDQEILHIDLHGFAAQPSFGEYDLILGTGHRYTVGESVLDRYFGEFMTRKGYRVYVPTETSREGERWTASNERTMVQKAKKEEIPKVASIQIETAPWFRRKGFTDQGKQLCRDMAVFIKEVQIDLPYLL